MLFATASSRNCEKNGNLQKRLQQQKQTDSNATAAVHFERDEQQDGKHAAALEQRLRARQIANTTRGPTFSSRRISSRLSRSDQSASKTGTGLSVRRPRPRTPVYMHLLFRLCRPPCR
ncbi:hypothetical protein HPB50_018891 [Hyalomma asiaticum]|uniref:Uncharacterized protein n=1 Tax=Hyalomma asiaticum TaxID=266040 RepID=A0ACB7TN29_HYAAI|nr:hypothetical protein HPB50_018891 [Hyalomma asiaticum]